MLKIILNFATRKTHFKVFILTKKLKNYEFKK